MDFKFAIPPKVMELASKVKKIQVKQAVSWHELADARYPEQLMEMSLHQACNQATKLLVPLLKENYESSWHDDVDFKSFCYTFVAMGHQQLLLLLREAYFEGQKNAINAMPVYASGNSTLNHQGKS